MVCLRKPQHAAVGILQEPHPDVEHWCGDLGGLIEAAEHQAVFRQSQLVACRSFGRRPSGGVVGVIAVRQMHDLLGEERLLVGRQHRLVGQYVIDVVRSGGRRITEIDDLDRRRAVWPQRRARPLRRAVQVDSDVDLKIVQQLGNLLVGMRYHLVMAIE